MIQKRFTVFLCWVAGYLLQASLLAMAQEPPPATFREAKEVMTKIYADHKQTFYCGCRFERKGKKLVVDKASCGLKTSKYGKRSNYVEWEHVVPAWAFGHQRQCWQKGGRKYCRRHDPVFVKMEADLQNLRPADGALNAARNNYRFGMIEGEPRQFGACDFEVDTDTRRVEPRPEIRGDIARTYLYMEQTYGLRISDQQRKLFEAWMRQDPVDEWEKERNRRIVMAGGNDNPFVSGVSGTEPNLSMPVAVDHPAFACGQKRYCKQMASCEEAEFYLNVCGLYRLDGDGDGVPCENLCR